MIKDITGGIGINVSSSVGSSYPYISPNSNNPSVGQLRLINGNFEVHDGSSWRIVPSSYATIAFSGETESLLAWVRKKRNEEQEREAMAERNPAIKDLMKQIAEKEDQIKMVMTLLKSSGNEGQVQTGS